MPALLGENNLYLLPDLFFKDHKFVVLLSSIYLYPSLCLFEGTKVSVGRGTDYPFEVIGFPNCKEGTFHFTPARLKARHTKRKGHPRGGAKARPTLMQLQAVADRRLGCRKNAPQPVRAFERHNW